MGSMFLQPIFMFGFSSYASANVAKLSSTIDGLHIFTINDFPVAPVEESIDEPVLNCDRDLPVNPEGKIVSFLG